MCNSSLQSLFLVNTLSVTQDKEIMFKAHKRWIIELVISSAHTQIIKTWVNTRCSSGSSSSTVGHLLHQRMEEGGSCCCPSLKPSRTTAQFYLLFLLIALYMLVGALVFSSLERPAELQAHQLWEKRSKEFRQKHDISFEDLKSLLRHYEEARTSGVRSEEARALWDLPGAFYFVGTVISTIGESRTPCTRRTHYTHFWVLIWWCKLELRHKIPFWKIISRHYFNKKTKSSGLCHSGDYGGNYTKAWSDYRTLWPVSRRSPTYSRNHMANLKNDQRPHVLLRSIKWFLTFIAVINEELIAHCICKYVLYILYITSPLCLLCVFVPRLWNSLPNKPKSANLPSKHTRWACC